MIKTEVAIKVASTFHGGWGFDRVFYANLSKHFPNFSGTGLYTTNYRIDIDQPEGRWDFFKQGNELLKAAYQGQQPWKKV